MASPSETMTNISLPLCALTADQRNDSSQVLVNRCVYWGHLRNISNPKAVSASERSLPDTKSESLKLLHNQRAAWPMGECTFSENCFYFYKRIRNWSSSSVGVEVGVDSKLHFRGFLNFLFPLFPEPWTFCLLYESSVPVHGDKSVSPVHRAWLFSPGIGS